MIQLTEQEKEALEARRLVKGIDYKFAKEDKGWFTFADREPTADRLLLVTNNFENRTKWHCIWLVERQQVLINTDETIAFLDYKDKLRGLTHWKYADCFGTQISVERTGNIFSIAGSEYLATFPDGSTQTFWSPPWHDYDSEEEDANALLYAAQQYAEKIKVKTDKAKLKREDDKKTLNL